jgi:glycosyltransferase involved in cell wall biosynthesis
MSAPRQLSASVLICTFNRAALLRETLESLRNVSSTRSWSIVLVDNNSTDHTAAVVGELASSFPVPLEYVFESRQGKSYALNTGLQRCAGDVIFFTDDDVRVSADWLDAGCAALENRDDLDYTGGPVRPLWGAAPPAWLDTTRGHLWGTLAILDYGAVPFVFEERHRVPLGANMAVRRRLIERIGGFHPKLGRRGRSLMGQEQGEFFARGRAAGARGCYVPGMEVHHHVAAARLTKGYFRRWWFWKGVSRARVDAMHRWTELGLDLYTVPYVARVPRFIFGCLVRAMLRGAAALLRADWQGAARHEMQCCYAFGYIWACWCVEVSCPEAPQLRPRQQTAAVAGIAPNSSPEEEPLSP